MNLYEVNLNSFQNQLTHIALGVPDCSGWLSDSFGWLKDSDGWLKDSVGRLSDLLRQSYYIGSRGTQPVEDSFNEGVNVIAFFLCMINLAASRISSRKSLDGSYES